MSTIQSLPDQPNLEQLKKRAKELAAESGQKLTEAQFALATSYGFASWPKLKEHIETVTTLTRLPDEVGGDEFLALACLTYGNDSPARWTKAAEMLAADPSLAMRDTWHAAACAHADGVTGDPSTQGGPFAWEPLMYLCYSRVPATEAAVLATATKLLDAGADPNVGYLWHGLSTPFTALTGVLGGGEQSQPEHPHWRALAGLLLERGAEPNDAQGLYNRMFRGDSDHLALLFEFGLGHGDGGPWRRLLGVQTESIESMLERQMRWAVLHDMTDRIELLRAHGVTNEVAPPTALLIQAAALGRVDEVRRLAADGWDVNAMGRGDIFTDEPWQTALHAAVERNDAVMMAALLQLGADPSIKDARFDATPAGWAEHFGYMELVPLLEA